MHMMKGECSSYQGYFFFLRVRKSLVTLKGVQTIELKLKQIAEQICVYVAVPGRNRTLFRCAIRPHYRCSAKLPLRAGLIRAAKMHEYLCSVYEPRPCGNAVEIHNGIISTRDCQHINVWKTIDKQGVSYIKACSVSYVSVRWWPTKSPHCQGNIGITSVYT